MSTVTESVPQRGRAVVVGGGVVGMASALWLQRDGWSVLVCDPREPGEGCSFGNAGIVAVNQVTPPFSAGSRWKSSTSAARRGDGSAHISV